VHLANLCILSIAQLVPLNNLTKERVFISRHGWIWLKKCPCIPYKTKERGQLNNVKNMTYLQIYVNIGKYTGNGVAS